jgi:hypothetical protein
MATRLFDLKIQHVAGVDRPANKRTFLVIKSEKIEKQMSIKKEGDKFCLYDGETKKGEYDSMDAAQAAKDKMMSKGATMLTKEQIAAIKDEELQAAILKQQEEMLEMQKKAKESEEKPAPTNPDDETIWKGVPPAIRNRFEAIEKERDAFAKKAKDEKDERETEFHIRKSEEFKYLNLVPKHFGKVMKAVAENAPQEAEEIYRILHVADGLIEKGGFFSEYGKGKGQNGILHSGDASNITDRVNALAHDYMAVAKREGKELTEPDAIVKVFNDHPDWHTQWRREQVQSVKVQ